MIYEQLKHLKPSAFKRKCGVRCETFKQMVELLRSHLDRTGKGGGQCKKKQRTYYSGKKKRHTLKAQVVVNQANGQIICTAFGKGKMHDFRLFKQYRVPMLPAQLCLTDKGYQGISKLHPSSCTPTTKPRKAKLNKCERQHNRLLAQLRVVAEHVNRRLKIFRILAERYRNRRRHFGLRFNLIAAILNFELALTS